MEVQMKNKSIIAVVTAFVCFAVLLGVLIWSITKPQDQPEEPDNGTQTEVDPGKQEEPAPSDTDEDTTEVPIVDEPTDDETPGSDDKPTVDEPTVDHTQSPGTLNPNPTTKEEIEAVLNDPFMILVNRERKVSSDYVGKDLVTYSGSYKLNSTCAEALRRLMNAGKKAGYSYTLYSAYRSYSSQYSKYYNKIDYWKGEGYSEAEAIRLTNEYYAPPGASEHHTGLAADVCIPAIVNKYACLHENYDQTEEFKWFSSHAHEYGFILRYPNGDEEITGYSYEPWHYRYVGVEIATEIYKRGVTLEEYVEDLEVKLAAFS